MNEPLDASRRGRVQLLTLNRPDRLNALTPELHDALLHALRSAAEDDGVGAVVLTGAGRAFCSGGDIAPSRPANGDGTPPKRSSLEQHAKRLIHHGESARLLQFMPKPTIALVNGAAAGAGMALALACDFRIGTPEALFRTSYINVALSGDFGISYFLQRLVGRERALELLLLNEKVGAEWAERLGLLGRIVSAETALEETLAFAARLADGPTATQLYIKRNINVAATASLEAVIESEAFAMARCARTEEAREAVTALREKRAPIYHRD